MLVQCCWQLAPGQLACWPSIDPRLALTGRSVVTQRALSSALRTRQQRLLLLQAALVPRKGHLLELRQGHGIPVLQYGLMEAEYTAVGPVWSKANSKQSPV